MRVSSGTLLLLACVFLYCDRGISRRSVMLVWLTGWQVLMVRKPSMPMGKEWTLTFL